MDAQLVNPRLSRNSCPFSCMVALGVGRGDEALGHLPVARATCRGSWLPWLCQALLWVLLGEFVTYTAL